MVARVPEESYDYNLYFEILQHFLVDIMRWHKAARLIALLSSFLVIFEVLYSLYLHVLRLIKF